MKVVFYGPGMAGKTTCMNYLHHALRPDARGQIVSVTTGGDRTMFFDFFPIPSPRLQGNALRVQLYAAPGELRSDSTRRALLEGVDGLVFVADSQRVREMDNIESLQELQHGLTELGLRLEQVPHVFAWNKRDCDDVLPLTELALRLNLHKAPAYETVAPSGRGVFDTLKSITGLLLTELTGRRGRRQNGHSGASMASTGKRLQAVSDAQQALAGLTEELADVSGSMVISVTPSMVREEGSVRRRPALPVLDDAIAAPPTYIKPRAPEQKTPPPAVRDPYPTPMPFMSPIGANFQRRAPLGKTGLTPRRPLSGPPASGAPSSDETQPRRRSPQGGPPRASGTPPSPTWIQPLSPEGADPPTGVHRELRLSRLLPLGALRDQLQEIESELATGLYAQAVRRATLVFRGLTVKETASEPEEGTAFGALALGLPADRYLRFREAGRNADAGTAALEDGLFSLFFLLDAILRR